MNAWVSFMYLSFRPSEIVLSYMSKLQVIKDGVMSELKDTGYTSHSYTAVGNSGRIYCVGASPVKFSSVISFDPATGKVRQDNSKRSVIYYILRFQLCSGLDSLHHSTLLAGRNTETE